MSKVYLQRMPEVWTASTTCLTASDVETSGSFLIAGYTQLVGIIICSGSGAAATNSLQISFSPDSGSNWDHTISCGLTACSGSIYSIEVHGNAACMLYNSDTTADSDEFRAYWALRPIA